MQLFTIGFAGATAEEFFEQPRGAGVRRVLDVRLNNTSQLAGFTKRGDLEFFLDRVGGIGYRHLSQFAPTGELLRAYREGGDWRAYERACHRLMDERRADRSVDASLLDGGCLLCSEATAERCHRRLVAERLARVHPGLKIRHLGRLSLGVSHPAPPPGSP